MTGVIWVIQILHYPAFADIKDERFQIFHHQHSQRITWIVAPVMTLELISAIALVWITPNGFWVANLAGVLAIWASTAFLSVPLHNKLSAGKNLLLIEKLVRTNWPRTLLWTVRMLLLYFVAG